jgi:hypothetical protein
MIERNLRYGLPKPELLHAVLPEAAVLGADAHSQRDLDRWREVVRPSPDSRVIAYGSTKNGGAAVF